MRPDHKVYSNLFQILIAVHFIINSFLIRPLSFYYFHNDQICTYILLEKYCILLPDDRAYARETRITINFFYTLSWL